MRRPGLLFAVTLVGLLAGCQATGPGGPAPDVTPNAVAGDPIEVTALAPLPGEAAAGADPTEAPPAETAPAAAATTTDETADEGTEEAPEAEPETAAPKSEAQLACERRRGMWSRAPNGNLMTCIFTTRDAGKRCIRESDCEGQCLARSGTCAPIRPLLGCNEILQDNGARVTQCIE
jgi:hypothetical protein